MGRSEADVPAEVDFDLLWYRVYRPVLAEPGYRPVRADADVGSLIITEMIQRLVLGDIVVADLTLPNANVYYEVGVRHAARESGCILTAAAWAKPVFDLAQMRQVRFPLADGLLGESCVITARAHLTEGLGPLVAATSPVFESMPGYPQPPDPQRLSAFADLADELMAFDADVREAYLGPQADRRERALEVLARHGHKPAVREADALMLLGMAFDRGDVAEAQRLLPEVAAEGPAAWKIETTLADLRVSVDDQPDEKVRRQLNGVLTALQELLPPASPAEGDDKESRQ